MTTTIDMTNSGQREHFRICQLIAALTIEVRTGMSMSRGSVMNAARQEYGIAKRTKAGVLGDLRTIYRTTYGREYGQRGDQS